MSPAGNAQSQKLAIPQVVFAVAVGSGLVSSLARPGGNATGLVNQSQDIAGKQMEIFGTPHRAGEGLRSDDRPHEPAFQRTACGARYLYPG